MSSRALKWIVLVLLPILLALYASYPPGDVVLEERRVERKIAETLEEAQAHGVRVGGTYVVDEQVLKRRWLPLAFGQRAEEVQLVERTEEGIIVERQSTTMRGRVQLGLDIAGGTELLYQLRPQPGEKISDQLPNIVAILKQRIDPANVKEYRIQTQENDRVLIQVPAATAAEVEQLKRRLEKMGKLEFKIAVPRPGPGAEAKFVRMYEEAEAGQPPDGYVRMYVEGDPANDYYLVKQGEPEITGRYLANVYPTRDPSGIRPAVGFEFNTIGARRFGQITEKNRGWALAIILDGALKSAPTIREQITARGIIEGQFTQQEVQDMVNILRAGSLPMDIELLQESTVGPQLGRDSIRRGLLSLAVAGLLVLAFVGIYYIGCGWVADGALLLNLVLLVGVLCLLGAALTLPGMAGILLTVGMAVDANVLIFERIREEQEGGKGVRLALRNGYDRAFTTIVDANVTTLLTAVILYVVGTGPVRGFAVTLSFGILLSMFTALYVTRLAFETFIDKGWMERFRMFQLFERPSIDFSRIRRPAYVLSLLVFVGGVLAFASRGSRLYDIDFTGGTLVRLALDTPSTVAEVRDRLVEAGYERAEVQGVRTTETGDELKQFNLRIKGAGVEELRGQLVPEVRSQLARAGLVGEADKLEVTPDGRGLALALSDPVTEMDIRNALAEGADPLNLPAVGAVYSPEEEAQSERYTVRMLGTSSLAGQRELWSAMLRALAWAGLRMQQVTVEGVEHMQDAGDAGLLLDLDRHIQPELLATELTRRQFGALDVALVDEEQATYVLTGPAEELGRFARELPAGARLEGIPLARIDGLSVTAELGQPYGESDMRALLQRQGIGEVVVVPLEARARNWRIDLSYESIRDSLRTAFADLAGGGVGVVFEPVEGGAEEGELLVTMQLDEPMVLAGIRNYIEAANLGPVAEGIIAREELYEPGILVSEIDIKLPAAQAEHIQRALQASFNRPQPVQKIVTIGPAVAEELQGRALLAVIFASVIIVLYVAARFHAFRFGVAAVIALVHDIVITAGIIAIADYTGVFGDVKLSLATLAAFLTILGYSLNDTIVVFDRIRENMVLMGRKSVTGDLINTSINQTLSRTVLTSLTTLVVVVVLYLFGGTVLQGLAFTLIVGVLVGTYSSMFIASPVLLDWESLVAGLAVFFRILLTPVRLPLKLLGAAFGGSR